MSAISKKPKLLSVGHSDHFQTPPEALHPLLPYLKRDWKIWECAMGKGNLVRALGEKGYHVEGTDILDWLQFPEGGIAMV